MKNEDELFTQLVEECNCDNRRIWFDEEEIIKALEILPCEELKDECLERLGIIRGLEE